MTPLRSRVRVVALGVLVAALATLGSGCKERTGPRPLRLGYFPNLTHAQALVGVREGHFARALGATPLEAKTFNAGPAAMEALVAGSLDVCYVGSGPAITVYTRAPGALHIVAGAAQGGAGLFVKDAQTPAQLVGQRVATPQLGNTQDVALRTYLREQGLRQADTVGGKDVVRVTPLTNADILVLFKRGELGGAWVPEPWGARLEAEAGAKLLVDERTLWPPDGKFPTTVLVVSAKALKERRAEVLALVQAHVALTKEALADPRRFAERANEAYGALTKKPLPAPVLQRAFSRLTLSVEPLEPQLQLIAQHAAELHYVPNAQIEGLVDTSLLPEASPQAP